MNKKIEERVNLYLEHANSEEQKLILGMDAATLEDAFGSDIAFGTAGLRGIMGPGFNRMNLPVINKTTYGFGNYLASHIEGAKEKGVVIAYDCRNNSKEFSKTAACVLAALGFKVYLFSDLRATPELSFAVRHLGCAGGIMITASHNPPKYNGYKVYDETGCQLVPELAEEVTNKIAEISDIFNVPTMSFEDALKSGKLLIIDKEVDDAYIEAVRTVKVQKVNPKAIKIVYTPLHGTGAVHMVKLLESEGYIVYPVKEQMVADGNFSTLVSPNPEEASAFEYAIALGKKVEADILIATDPDADRMGIAVREKDNSYTLLTGNQTGAVLLDYLAKFVSHDQNSYVFNTIVTSNIAEAICKDQNLTLVQTLTGFKYIGEQARLLEGTNKKFFFGYEESYGSVIKPFVRDKDSHQATLLLAEVAAYYKEKGMNLREVLETIYAKYGYYVESVINIALAGVAGAKRIAQIMAYFKGLDLDQAAGKKIVTKEDYDDSVRITNGVKSKINLPKSLVIKFIFDDGGWFVLRPSGTEPKLKIYIAVCGKNKEEASLFVDALKKEIMQHIDSLKEE